MSFGAQSLPPRHSARRLRPVTEALEQLWAQADRSGSEFVSGAGGGAGRDRVSGAAIVPSQSRLVS